MFVLIAITAKAEDTFAKLKKKGATSALACTACHDLTPAKQIKIAPPLWEVLGRPIASIENFPYSAVLKRQKGSWTIDEIDIFLTNPVNYRGETSTMGYLVTSKQNRLEIIAYLTTLGENSEQTALFQKKIATEGIFASEESTTPQNWDGLPAGTGQQKVFYTCNICHSLAIVKQQKLSRSSWEETLDWMVEEQEMSELNAEDKKIVLDYLSTYFNN